MPLTRSTLERQLEIASADLDAWTKALNERGVEKKTHRRDPKWRSLNARCRSLKSRLRSVSAIETREEDARRRKEEQPAESE